MRRRTSLVAVTATLAGTMAFASAGTVQACASRGVRSGLRSGALLETVGLRTYRVEVKPDKKSYRVGDLAKVHVTVTRPAEEDPIGQGIPINSPESFPAEGVNVGIGLRIGEVFLFGHNVTDAEGHTLVKIKIASYAPPGEASADAYAWKTQVDSTCARVEENGYTSVPNLFTVLRGAR